MLCVKMVKLMFGNMQVLVDNHGSKDEGAMVDFRGKPVDKSKTGGWLAAGLILGNPYIMQLCSDEVRNFDKIPI